MGRSLILANSIFAGFNDKNGLIICGYEWGEESHTLFTVTNFGESHGPAIGCVIDGCPPGMPLSEADIQIDLDRRRPGTSRHVTQRNEPDAGGDSLGGVREARPRAPPLPCSFATPTSAARTTATSRRASALATPTTPTGTSTAFVTLAVAAARLPADAPTVAAGAVARNGYCSNTARSFVRA